jgi:hypothetical protein
MKTRQSKIERLIAKGMLHCNEAAAVVDTSTAVDTGGGSDASSSAGESSGDSSGIDWGHLNDQFSDDSDDAPTSAQPVATQTTGTAQTAAPAAATPTGEPAAAVQPVQQQPQGQVEQQPQAAQQPAAPVQQAEQQPVQQPQMTEEQLQTQRNAARETWKAGLINNYALSEEQAAMVISDPGSVLPAMAADIHMRMLDDTAQFIRTALPDMIAQTMKQNQALEEGQNLFFTEWPELKGKEDMVMRMGQLWRQQNPYASREEFIKQVGPLAWNAAGLSLQDLVSRGGRPQPQGNPAPVVQQSGYSPVPQGAGGGGMQQTNDPDNEFARLALNWEND